MATTLEIKDLHVSIESKQILKGVNLKVTQGEIHAVMGPNGSGKSTLANTLMGHPKYKVDSGDILVNGESIVGLTPDVRRRSRPATSPLNMEPLVRGRNCLISAGAEISGAIFSRSTPTDRAASSIRRNLPICTTKGTARRFSIILI